MGDERVSPFHSISDARLVAEDGYSTQTTQHGCPHYPNASTDAVWNSGDLEVHWTNRCLYVCIEMTF